MANLIEGLIEECNRVRDLETQYRALDGGVGIPAATLMRLSIERAEKAIASGDAIEGMLCYTDLQGFTG